MQVLYVGVFLLSVFISNGWASGARAGGDIPGFGAAGGRSTADVTDELAAARDALGLIDGDKFTSTLVTLRTAYHSVVAGTKYDFWLTKELSSCKTNSCDRNKLGTRQRCMIEMVDVPWMQKKYITWHACVPETADTQQLDVEDSNVWNITDRAMQSIVTTAAPLMRVFNPDAKTEKLHSINRAEATVSDSGIQYEINFVKAKTVCSMGDIRVQTGDCAVDPNGQQQQCQVSYEVPDHGVDSVKNVKCLMLPN